MTIEPIGLEAAGSPASTETARPAGADFSSWLMRELNEVNDKIGTADLQVRQLAVGETTNVHQVMIALEKARMSLELVVQVRNKCLEAYQSLMQMQI
jgi:flagellar hook-basal body complex protein FliE